MGCFRSSKRVTVHFRRRTKKVNSSVIWPPIKKCHKMKYTFHPHFCSKFQSSRLFWPKIAEIAKSGQKSQHATRSVIWPQIKKCHKMIYTFHPHFCSKFQGPRPFRPKIAKIDCVLAFFGLIWLFRLFLVKPVWALEILKKMGCFRGFKRATVPQRCMYEQTIILSICGQNWMGAWNLDQK